MKKKNECLFFGNKDIKLKKKEIEKNRG